MQWSTVTFSDSGCMEAANEMTWFQTSGTAEWQNGSIVRCLSLPLSDETIWIFWMALCHLLNPLCVCLGPSGHLLLWWGSQSPGPPTTSEPSVCIGMQKRWHSKRHLERWCCLMGHMHLLSFCSWHWKLQTFHSLGVFTECSSSICVLFTETSPYQWSHDFVY